MASAVPNSKLAFGAVANMLHLSWEIERRSIIGLRWVDCDDVILVRLRLIGGLFVRESREP